MVGQGFFSTISYEIQMSSLETNRVQFEAALLVLLEGLNTGTSGSGSTILPARLSLINYVKAKLDELIPEGEGVSFNLSDTPNISDPLDLLINPHLDESTKDIILSAPLTVLFPTAMGLQSGKAFETGGKTGYVMLPQNFLRLSSFKMADWKKDISIPITTENVAYILQQFALRRGSVNFPVAALNWLNIPVGGLKTMTIAAGGTGYAPGKNIITVVQSGGVGGQIVCTSNSSGVITSIDSVYMIGSGYVVANGLATTGGTGTGFVVNITVLETAGLRRTIEYYSISDSHVVDKLFYIPETLAEDFVVANPNLLDSLAWQCAGKIMQITGMVNEAKLAQERVQQSYNNL